MTLDFSSSCVVLAQGTSNAALIVFFIYIAAVFALAVLSNKLLQSKNFMSEYFLGSRSLGVWAFALTFAATSASGGSFTGFPSKIYTHGWVLGLWIGSYIVVPICAMGLLGKRINQVARISGAITVPDILRDRFRSPLFGLMTVSLIVFFMSFNLVAQFKAGSAILKTLLQDVAIFNEWVSVVGRMKSNIGYLQDVDPAYLLCLGAFALAVIVYTTYGGFRAVVWTDVMQGVVMVVGVLIMLPLAIWQVGGLTNATEKLARMTPPRLALVKLELKAPPNDSFSFSSPWFTLPSEDEDRPRLFRVSQTLTIPAGAAVVEDVKVVELTTPDEIDRQLIVLANREKSVLPLINSIRKLKESQIKRLNKSDSPDEVLISQLSGELESLDSASVALLNAPGFNAVRPEITIIRDYTYGAGKQGVYVTGPGPAPPHFPPDPDDPNRRKKTIETPTTSGFLPLSLAISFFFMWAISGAGQPSSMVRLMAFNSCTTLRRSIFTVALYYSMIYFPLVIIFACSRVMLPGMDLESDRIMPQMAVTLTSNIGMGWLAGLLVAAPFAAVMSTVDSFLLMISSALVRDIYQRNINPEAKEKTIKYLCYFFTLMVGGGAMLGAINPPRFLQDIIVYTGSGLAACFLAPMVFGLYWPRSNATGCITGMVLGFSAHFSMYVGGIFANGSFFDPYRLMNFDPILIGLFVSFAGVYIATKLSAPPAEDLVHKYFYRKKQQ